MDGKVLDYGDTLLRVRDVALLTGPHWLNDAVMNFYFEYLRRTNASAGEENASNKVVFIDASVSFLLANMDASEAGVILEQTGANQAEHVLLLVNDNVDVTHAGGGSHWSLLVYTAPNAGNSMGVFQHFDSMPGHNIDAARALKNSFAGALRLVGTTSYSDLATHEHKQTNGYNCGVFALAYAHECLRFFTEEHKRWDSFEAFMRGRVTQETVDKKRKELLRLIETLAENEGTT